MIKPILSPPHVSSVKDWRKESLDYYRPAPPSTIDEIVIRGPKFVIGPFLARPACGPHPPLIPLKRQRRLSGPLQQLAQLIVGTGCIRIPFQYLFQQAAGHPLLPQRQV